MVSTRKKKKKQQKTQLSQLNGSLNNFFIGNSVNVNVSEIESREQETNSQSNDSERVNDGARQNQVQENKIDDQISRVHARRHFDSHG